MRRFRYVFDPLCVLGCALYAVNRWEIKPHFHNLFFHSWFNDSLLIPCALPPVLWLQRWLGLRTHDGFPTLAEIFWHWLGWSILFEGIGPYIMPTVGDPWDVVAYGGGAVVALALWRWMEQRKTTTRTANFDWLAPHYRWLEWILAGPKLQRCRAAFLETLPEPRHVLVVGQGHGRFVAELMRRFPNARCTCVDSSRAMLGVTRRRLEACGLNSSRVELVHSDILEWVPTPGAYDLVATHFVLDCFRPEQLVKLMQVLRLAAAAEARWLVSDFREPAAGLARWRARAILEMMYWFFRWAVALPASELTAPDALLNESGFVLRERRIFEWGLLHSDLWQLRET